MKEKVGNKLILFIITILIATVLGLYFKPRYVELELVKSIHNSEISVNDGKNDFSSELHWWFIKNNPILENSVKLGTVSPDLSNHLIIFVKENLKDWGIDFDEMGIDFDKNNIIIAFSREIKEMKFKRADWFPYHTVSAVKTIMSKRYNHNTIYVYKILKFDVCEDFRVYTDTTEET